MVGPGFDSYLELFVSLKGIRQASLDVDVFLDELHAWKKATFDGVATLAAPILSE